MEATRLDGIIRDIIDVFLRELHDLCGDFTAVKKVNLNEIKEEPWQSPSGKYAVSFKGIFESRARNHLSFHIIL
jgi:hypothetical protein